MVRINKLFIFTIFLTPFSSFSECLSAKESLHEKYIACTGYYQLLSYNSKFTDMSDLMLKDIFHAFLMKAEVKDQQKIDSEREKMISEFGLKGSYAANVVGFKELRGKYDEGCKVMVNPILCEAFGNTERYAEVCQSE